MICCSYKQSDLTDIKLSYQKQAAGSSLYMKQGGDTSELTLIHRFQYWKCDQTLDIIFMK